jgi:hypothetical protein
MISSTAKPMQCEETKVVEQAAVADERQQQRDRRVEDCDDR